jgi:ABC-type glycerol-3-phosphate transport system permease component
MKERLHKIILRNVFVWCCVAFFVFPFYWLITTALKNRVDAFSVPPKWLFTPIFDNFVLVFTTGEFMASYYNSLIIAVLSTFVSLIIGLPMAYGLSNRFRVKNRQGILLWILSTKMAPPIMVAIPFYILFRVLYLRDTYAGMVLVYLIFNLSFAVWMIHGFIDGVPKDLEEAARVDGSTRIRALFVVVLPLIKGGIAATSIICFITSWNEFLMALVLTSSTTKTAPVAITSFISFEGIRWGEIAAAGVLIALPVIIMGVFVRKYLISGMTMGAIK